MVLDWFKHGGVMLTIYVCFWMCLLVGLLVWVCIVVVFMFFEIIWDMITLDFGFG